VHCKRVPAKTLGSVEECHPEVKVTRFTQSDSCWEEHGWSFHSFVEEYCSKYTEMLEPTKEVPDKMQRAYYSFFFILLFNLNN